MILNLELVDDAGQKFGNQVVITDLDAFAYQLGQVGLQLRQLVTSGQAKFVARPPILIADRLPPTSNGNSGNGRPR